MTSAQGNEIRDRHILVEVMFGDTLDGWLVCQQGEVGRRGDRRSTNRAEETM